MAQDIRLNLAAAGNASTNVNVINPRFQANALRGIRGLDVGVIDTSFYTNSSADGSTRVSNNAYMWPIRFIGSSTCVIGKGLATAYGYDIQNEAEVEFNIGQYITNTNVFIYLKFDLSSGSEGVGTIGIMPSSSKTFMPPSQSNLIINPTGIYYMPLYLLVKNEYYLNWESLGVKTIKGVLRSQYATQADFATSANSAISAQSADYANYAKGAVSEGTIDSRLKAITARLDALGFKRGVISNFGNDYNTNITETYSLTKIGNYVIGSLDVIMLVPSSGTRLVGMLPKGFRPYSTQYQYIGSYTIYYRANGRIDLTGPYTPNAGAPSGTAHLIFGFDTTNTNYGG